MLTRLLVYLAYFLKTSARYQSTKHFFRRLLVIPQSQPKAYFDVFMLVMVIISVFLQIDKVSHQPPQWQLVFEDCIVALFIIEYLLRAWIHNDNHQIILDHYERSEYLSIPVKLHKVFKTIAAKKIEYALSPLALIDLLAILPSYRPLRFLRVFLIFRLFKLFRYINSIKLFTQILFNKRFELYTLGVFLGLLLFIGSIAIFLFENPDNGGDVHDLFDAFYLAVVTMSTVGYGDIAPQTAGGRLVVMGLIFTGLGVLSFFTSIIVSAFTDKVNDLKENRVYAELQRHEGIVIICGFGRVGMHVARQLADHQQPFVIIDKLERHIEDASRLGYLTIQGDASNNDVLSLAGINRNASAILCTTGDDVSNVYITLTSRQLNADIRIISRAYRHDNVRKLYQAGADNVIEPFEIAGMVAAEYVGQPVAFGAIAGIMHEEKEFVLDTVRAHPGSAIIGKKIAEIDFDHSKLMLIGVISTDPPHLKQNESYQMQDRHFYFNPKHAFEVQEGDLLVVMGKRIGIDYFRYQLEKSRFKIGKKR
ncbi:potassium channel protein [Methylomicrobium sp. Wu6]|uniref:potassium channel protein n=1 Tax=Methylomicrobium sp. Wu6 TaxID=3107928 RepID=UPI002DD6A580|nr:potassium channel protein [Methylomicrobium sp. Wu6]MEC4747974.1 potassium channel protein [Methylomicrobium sp. Wu6]